MLFFRIYFMILFTYLRILLLVILAPVFMLTEAIPGQNTFVSWLKQIVGELITFPVLAGLFMIGALIVNNIHNPEMPLPADAYDTIWSPPFLGGVEPEAFLMVAGMGILFLIPDLVKMAKEAVGAKDMGVKFGLGTFLAGAGVGFAGGAGLVGKAGSLTTFLHGPGAMQGEGVGVFKYLNKLKGTVGEPMRQRGDLTKFSDKDEHKSFVEHLSNPRNMMRAVDEKAKQNLAGEFRKSSLSFRRGAGKERLEAEKAKVEQQFRGLMENPPPPPPKEDAQSSSSEGPEQPSGDSNDAQADGSTDQGDASQSTSEGS